LHAAAPRAAGFAASWLGGDRDREEFWRLLIAVAIALLLAESLFANRSTA